MEMFLESRLGTLVVVETMIFCCRQIAGRRGATEVAVEALKGSPLVTPAGIFNVHEWEIRIEFWIFRTTADGVAENS
jgi:hypothetical protein